MLNPLASGAAGAASCHITYGYIDAGHDPSRLRYLSELFLGGGCRSTHRHMDR